MKKFLFFLMFIFILFGLLVVHHPLDVHSSTDEVSCRSCHQNNEISLMDKGLEECQACHSEHLDKKMGGNLGDNPLISVYTRAERSFSFVGDVSEKRKPGGSPRVSEQEELIAQEMVYIPEGEFLMGNDGRKSSEGRGNQDEQPLHRVYLKGFWMDRYEVTNGMYEEFVTATQHRIPKHWAGGTYPKTKVNHPVVYVDWFDAEAYCQWTGKRLPTEQEWEKAARGTDGRVFPWGDQFDVKKANTPQSWLSKGDKGDTLPVGSYEEGKSPQGLYDMAGNVYEWTSSWYKPYPGNRFFNVHYGEVNKVLRGGSWYDCLSYGCGLSAPTYNRSRFTPKIRNKGFGFRCAKSGSS